MAESATQAIKRLTRERDELLDAGAEMENALEEQIFSLEDSRPPQILRANQLKGILARWREGRVA